MIAQVKQIVGDMPVYLTFDIDCLDPAFAPGTGTPVIGGLTSDRAIKLVRGLKDLNIVGMDVVEVAPAYDQSEITAWRRRRWRWKCCISRRRKKASKRTILLAILQPGSARYPHVRRVRSGGGALSGARP